MTAATMDTTEIARSYRERGFAVVRGAIPAQDLQPLRATIARGLDALARELIAKGEATHDHAHLDIEDRLPALLGEREFGRSWDDPVFGPELHALIQHPGLLAPLQSLLGEDVRFDGSHRLRPKLPHSELTAFPWHQDSQYYGPPSAGMHIVSLWVPLVDVDESNGCLWFIPGSQRWGLLPGARGADMNIRSPVDVEGQGTPEALPMRLGDIVLFSNLTVHGSKVNRTERVRWSLDLRYSAIKDPAACEAREREAREYYYSICEGSSPGMRVLGGPGPERFTTWNDRFLAARR
jgi:phytanoyl-CoA hydroxylase